MSEQPTIENKTPVTAAQRNVYITQIFLLILMLVVVVGLWWVFIKPQQAGTDILLQTQINELNQHQAQLDQRLTQLQNQLGESAQTWVLSEAYYYLSSAQLRLSAFDDVHTALQMMRVVRKRLQSVTSPPALQHALAEDISVLEAVQLPNLENITHTLSLLDEQVVSLPLAQTIQVQTEVSQEAQQTADPWKQALYNSWQELKSLIRVQHRDNNAVPDFTLGNELLLRQTVRVELQRASVAAVLGQADLYQTSLQQAQNALKNYFAAENSDVQTAIQTMNALMEQTINPQIPPANQALLWLENNGNGI